MIQVNRREIFRYLGYGTAAPDEATESLVSECLQALEEHAACRTVSRPFPLTFQKDVLLFAGIEVHSQSLYKNLWGCVEVELFAATLGPAVDRLIARFSHMQMSRATVMQAAAAAYIEAYCNACQQSIAEEVKTRGLYVRPRFSPGYGDFSISYQRDFVRILDTPRAIGLTLTEGFALAPAKSVTAIIGLSPTNEKCHIEGCESCTKLDCAYRRS